MGAARPQNAADRCPSNRGNSSLNLTVRGNGVKPIAASREFSSPGAAIGQERSFENTVPQSENGSVTACDCPEHRQYADS